MMIDKNLLDEKIVRGRLEKMIPDYCNTSYKLLDMLLAKIIIEIVRPIQSELRVNLSDACQKWEIEKVDRYWYYSGRYTIEYVEITFWFGQPNLERRETKRVHSCSESQKWERPDWAKNITVHNKSLSV